MENKEVGTREHHLRRQIRVALIQAPSDLHNSMLRPSNGDKLPRVKGEEQTACHDD